VDQADRVALRRHAAGDGYLLAEGDQGRWRDSHPIPRQAGINQKYARQFLSGLIAEKRIVVQKIPQEKKKSALGFIRAPAQPESRDAAEELF
jgi:hypothetical protein